MALLVWGEELSVGVKEIDRQHQQLIDMLNRFYDQVQADNKLAMKELLASMGKYTIEHFRTEERYFDLYHYADSARHKQIHRDFIAKVEDVKARLEAGKWVLTMEVTNFLKEWVTAHIKGEDKKYTKCLNDHGLH